MVFHFSSIKKPIKNSYKTNKSLYDLHPWTSFPATFSPSSQLTLLQTHLLLLEHARQSLPQGLCTDCPSSWEALLPDIRLANSFTLQVFARILMYNEAYPDHPVYNLSLTCIPTQHS